MSGIPLSKGARRAGLAAAVLLAWAGAAAEDGGLDGLMPRPADYTLTGWAEEFPGHTPAAPWRRVVRTGHYVFALDTDTLRIPHLGPAPRGAGYAEAAREDARAWARVPPAELELRLDADGKTYRAVAGGTWTDFAGPRLIESGRWVQRADVTDLAFAADDGTRLNVEARLEAVAWPDRLALILAARPGEPPIPAGEACFGRVGGGYGLAGTNHLEFPHEPALDPERLTLELWAFVPEDYQASERTHPWLAGKNHHEHADGNYGIVILDGRPQARLNVGGGREGLFTADSPARLEPGTWSHLAMTYDGESLRLYLNGAPAGARAIGRRRTAGRGGLVFGRRPDNAGNGYRFRGAVDEIRLYDRALAPDEILRRFRNPEAADDALKPARAWSFRADGQASAARPGGRWNGAAMEVRLTAQGRTLQRQWAAPPGAPWAGPEWREVAVALDPALLRADDVANPVEVRAAELPAGRTLPVEFDPARGWHRVNLDGIEPIVPSGGPGRENDALERVRLTLVNPSDDEQPARLLFEKTAYGIRQRIGSAITGVSAVLRDTNGIPTGIPVQLSKNWHNRPEGGVYAGQWFHGFAQVRLPPRARVELELTLAYGHWGGVAAASHAQLCLIGWGSNQLWDESALGAWGESICYEPDQAQAQAAVLDVRPLMVKSMSGDRPWGWTHNVGGADFFRLFGPDGRRVFPGRMRAAYERGGPCLTEVTYAGRLGGAIEHAETVSLARTDDLVRGTYRLRMDVRRAVDVSRFVIFQIGADSYSYTGERKMAVGDERGLIREWATQWGGDAYRTEPAACTGRVPWISLHEAAARREPGQAGAWANRGVVIRAWKARLGGKPAAPWVAEHGVRARGADTSTADLVPPPGVTRLEPGDFVEATLEHLVIPQSAEDYYGPDGALRAALAADGDTWRMVLREAAGNDRRVDMRTGRLERLYPDVRIRVGRGGAAEFTLAGGLGYVPVTLAGLDSPRGRALFIDGARVDQSVHGNDFWQADYDPEDGTWSLTYTIPACEGRPRVVRWGKEP